jgi:hypothetical protein
MRNFWKTLSRAAILAMPAIPAIFAATLLALPLAAQKTADEAKKNPVNPAEFERLVRPEDKFEILGRFAGTWEGELKAWLETQPPQQVTINEMLDTKWILNDRFLETHFSFTIGEMTNKGRVTMGYNGATKQFYRIFLGDWDPRGTFSTGVYIQSRNALIFRGMEHDPTTGDSFEKRDVFTFIDKDKISYEQFFRFADGSELKSVEGHYTRVTGK